MENFNGIFKFEFENTATIFEKKPLQNFILQKTVKTFKISNGFTTFKNFKKPLQIFKNLKKPLQIFFPNSKNMKLP
jgi:hypothetical protein